MTLVELFVEQYAGPHRMPIQKLIHEVLHEIDDAWAKLHDAAMRMDDVSEAYERGRATALSALLGDRQRYAQLER